MQKDAGVECTDLGLSVVAAAAPVRMFVSLHFNGAQHRARAHRQLIQTASREAEPQTREPHVSSAGGRYRAGVCGLRGPGLARAPPGQTL